MPRIVTDGDLAANAASFARHLRAANLTPNLVERSPGCYAPLVRHAIVALAFLLAGCGLGTPAPECDPGTDRQRARLPCDASVTAASRALPAGHPGITRVQFLYGSATPCCSYLYPVDEEAPVRGYVVFTYDDGFREYVDVSVWHEVFSVGTPETYYGPE